MDAHKYSPQYYLPPEPCFDWRRADRVTKAPIWCSVDLRDGNQALVIPMSLEKKLSFFQLLVEVGFREIEVGFPASSETEFAFVRTLIEKDYIPQGVCIQVLTQARDHIIRKTFEALEGVKGRVIVHVYNPISVAQREQVYGKSKEEILSMAVEGAKLVRELSLRAAGEGREFIFEYSPESFTGTEPAYALEVCNAVVDAFDPDPEHPCIVNLPVTVELSMPHVYASQVEYISRHLTRRDSVILSLHPHNDRGCAVADAELGLLAGAQRVEGTLFGNGERTGNVDLVTLALNLYSQGVDPGLDFSHLAHVKQVYESCTGMQVGERSPYSGSLVFTAFSGAHQDAIAKGFHYREEKQPDHWSVPYLPLDPEDLGICYDNEIIRINSQSGKGGVGFVLEHVYGLDLPPLFREAMGYAAKAVSDHLHKELSPRELLTVFENTFEKSRYPYSIQETRFTEEEGEIQVEATATYLGKVSMIRGRGNGRVDAVSNALRNAYGLSYTMETYKSHALGKNTSAPTMAYVGIRGKDGGMSWGAGTSTDVLKASVDALLSAINNRV